MTVEIQKSIDDFSKHLLSKIDVYNVSMPNESSQKAYNNIMEMFDLDNMKVEDIASLSKKELEELLDSICLSEQTKEKILNEFLTNKKEVELHKDYFMEIITHIKIFVGQYRTRSSLNQEYSSEKIDECKSFLSLMKMSSLDTYTSLDTFDKFITFINNQGLIDEDKANLIEHINELNLNLAKRQSIHPDLSNKVSNISRIYINEEYFDYINAANEILNESKIDLDTLETLAKTKADDYELRDGITLYNVILTLMIISKYNELKENNEDTLIELNDLFNKLHFEDKLLEEALVIIQENKNALLIDKKDADNYKELPLDELSDNLDEAIMLKLSSLIIRIKELYDEIIYTNKESEDYQTLRSKLSDLIHEENFMNEVLIKKR